MASQEAPMAEREDLDLNGVKLEERPIAGDAAAPRKDEVWVLSYLGVENSSTDPIQPVSVG